LWYGISGQTNEWIQDFLFGRTQHVVVDGCSSSTKQVLSDVPQGSVLGPCLFLFYINDIAKDLHSTVHLFADDTMIYSTVSNERDAGLLQQDLNTLSQWADTWMMEFHPQKCEVISITRKRKPMKYTYSLVFPFPDGYFYSREYGNGGRPGMTYIMIYEGLMTKKIC